jgi:hypothetical protein
MPTASDLVTDLPADFETFGQAVATSMADLLGGTTGQVLSKASNTDMDFTWVTSDDANAIQNTIVDAKGDIIAATANDTPARLAVGANNTVLTADSSTATGLKWATPVTSGFVGARVFNSANQAISNATGTFLSFNSEDLDTNNFHDNSTNNSRLTVPTGYAGKYLATFQLRYYSGADNGVGTRVGSIQKNRTNVLATYSFIPNASIAVTCTVSTIVNLVVGDYLEVDTYQTSGTTMNTFGTSDCTFFQLLYLGA